MNEVLNKDDVKEHNVDLWQFGKIEEKNLFSSGITCEEIITYRQMLDRFIWTFVDDDMRELGREEVVSRYKVNKAK